jgi:hypothetical protein
MTGYITAFLRVMPSPDPVTHCLAEIVRDPTCLIDLTVAALYLAGILALLYDHRWMRGVYLALAVAHVAAAVTHGAAHP